MFDLFKVILLLLLFNTEASVLRNNVKRQTPDLHYNMTEREYKMYFGEDTQSQNPEYDVSYLMNVNERGEATSDRRMKRSAKDHFQIYYNISLFGRDFHLNLTLNKQLLAPNFHIETKHENGTNFKSATSHMKFYHGHVVSHPNSIVSLSGDDSLSGTVGVTDDEVYMIHPLPAHLSKKYVNSKEKRPHLVVKRNIINNVNSTYIDDNEDSNKDFIDTENNSDSNQLNKRQTNEQTSKILEVTYVADHLSTEHFGMIELPEMLMSIGNIVSRLFYDRSFGKRKVTYVIKRILLIYYKSLAYAANATAEVKLSKITEWAHKNNIVDEMDPNHADQTVLFTIGNIGGLASLGTLCRRIDASGVVSLNGLSSAFVTAHETFHNFGYVHDGTSVNANCPNGAAVMSPILPSGNAAFVWSECSRNFSQKYLSSDQSRCLDNKPISKGPTQSPLLRAKLPGEIFDANKQCEMIFGIGRVQCWSKKTDCSSLYCSKDASSCSYILAPPADGTRCGDRHWCIKGKCVDDGSPIVNGNWGEWSEYSSCTLTCGIGVQHRARKCDNPSPKNGGKTCVGPNVGQYRTCNKMACAAGSMSFRKQQCIKLGRMRDYIKKSEVCNLWCMNGWYVRHHGKAKDGTRCSNDLTDNNICVDGKCQSVGCDNEYNSGKEKDRCGICDGDGSTCELRVISYTKRFYNFGTKNPFSMVTLKTGSANIVARKLAATYNYLGICNMKGEYLIILPSWSTTVYKAGTKISYFHEHNMYADKIAIPGPLTDNLTLVFVHIYEDNQGVIIRYYEPIENVIKPSEDIFFWKEYHWTACSKTCAGGIRKKKVKCLRNDDSVVGNRFCSKKPKPAEQEACNIQDCPPEWFVTAWTPCSRRCGKGTQMREIICRRQTVKSWKVVNDLECAGPPPAESLLQRYCNEIICPPEYVGLSWSQCSETCGEGNATRKLECLFINEEGIRQSIPSEKCELEGSPKPPTVQRCNHDIPCEESIPTYNWLGCYKDKSERTMPEMLANLRPKINWHKPENTIKECAIIAHENHKSLFAIQYYGECRSYSESNAKLNYAMYGSSHDFWSGLGGTWTNCVYAFV